MSIVTMTITMASISMDTMAISIVAIIGTSISTCFSLPRSSCKQAEGNNSLVKERKKFNSLWIRCSFFA